MTKKVIFSILAYLISVNTYYPQEQEEVLYINFKENSPDFFWKEGEVGEKVKTETFLKNHRSNGDIYFFIKGLLFIHHRSQMRGRSISCQEIKKKNLLSVNEVEKHINLIQEKYPLGYKYPSKEFPKMYIVYTQKGEGFLFEVKWQYYND